MDLRPGLRHSPGCGAIVHRQRRSQRQHPDRPLPGGRPGADRTHYPSMQVSLPLIVAAGAAHDRLISHTRNSAGRDQAEIDHYWKGPSTLFEAEQCGWLNDRFGVSWQILRKIGKNPGAASRRRLPRSCSKCRSSTSPSWKPVIDGRALSGWEDTICLHHPFRGSPWGRGTIVHVAIRRLPVPTILARSRLP